MDRLTAAHDSLAVENAELRRTVLTLYSTLDDLMVANARSNGTIRALRSSLYGIVVLAVGLALTTGYLAYKVAS